MTSMERPASVLELLELATTALRAGAPPSQAIAVQTEEGRLVLEIKVADRGEALAWVAELAAVAPWVEDNCTLRRSRMWWWHGRWRSAVVQIHHTTRAEVPA